MQATSSAAQIVASFVIGDIARKVGSIKWTIITLISLSFVGNFLYSCASVVSLATIIGGRILCGVASASGALIYSYITASHKDRTKVFSLVSAYRTAAGVFMALSQLIAIFGSYANFHVKGLRISGNNAPTFICSFLMLLVVASLVLVLKNPQFPPKAQSMSFGKALKEFGSTGFVKVAGSIIVLWSMFMSSFLMSEVVYFMPVFLTLALGWDVKFQGVSFMVASMIGICGSLFFPRLVTSLTKEPPVDEENASATASSNESKASGTTASLREEKNRQIENYKKHMIFRNQIILSVASLGFTLVGQAFMIGAAQSYKHGTLPHINVGCFFVAGLSLIMLGYNGMASTFPALFSEFVKPAVKVQLMPMIGAIAALGKLVAPIVLSNLYETKLGLSIAVGFGMILTVLTVGPVYWLNITKSKVLHD